MLNSKKLREDIAAKLDQVAAVNALCEKDGREPTAEESTLVANLIGADGKGGEVAAMNQRLAQAEAFEAEVAKQRQTRIPGGVHHEQAGIADSQSIFARVKIPASAAARAPVTSFVGPDADKQAYAFGQFALAIGGRQPANNWCRDTLGIDVQNAMSSGADSDGGFLIPSEFEANLIRLVDDYGTFRRSARNVPMTRETLEIPRRSAGSSAYFIGEIETPTESTPTLDMVKLTARNLGALAYYSRILDEDSAIGVGNMIMTEMALAVATKEDQCGYLGDGTSTYGGIVGLKTALATYSTVTAASGNTGFKTLDLEDFEEMIATLPGYAFMGGGPSWYIHRSAWAVSMLRLAAAASGASETVVINGVPQTRFLGYPVVFSEVLNNTLTAQTSTSGLCYFGNLRQAAAFGDRRGFTMDVSREVKFLTRQVAILGTERFDINIHERGTASGAGPIVMLATPGS